MFNFDWLLSPEAGFGGLFAAVAGWVGRVNQRTTRNESDVRDLREDMKQHIAEDSEAHQRVARIEGTLHSMSKQLNRIEEGMRARQ